MEEFSIVPSLVVGFLVGKALKYFVKKTIKQSANFKYFIIELVTAVVTCVLFLKLGLSFELLVLLALFYTLIILSFIDLKLNAVPDYLLLIALFLAFSTPSKEIFEQFRNAFYITGAVVLLAFLLNFYVQNIKSRIYKDEKMKMQTTLGEGDIPVIAILGAILGIQNALYALFLASFFAIIPALYNKFLKKELETAFIPFLSLGFFVEYSFEVSKVFN